MLTLPKTTEQGQQLGYVRAISTAPRRFITITESLGGVGLILPGLTGILPWLTSWAVVGLVIVMVGAVIFHIPRKEYPNIVFNLILLAMAVFVGYERHITAHI